jgi:site-specific DNA recombinase
MRLLSRLLNTIGRRAPFAALFLADKDRLGREQFETNHILKQISLAGVRIYEYQNGGHEVRLESPIDKLIMSVSNFAAELERAKASQRTRDALQLKAQRGYVSGGAVFGYRNVAVLDEGGWRSHVVREIRDDEAAIVRRIFEMVASGDGQKKIAMALNVDGARAPRPRPGRHRSWAPSSVRAILFNPLYKGEVVWGRRKKRDSWGRRKQTGRPASDWVVTKIEHLRIVSDDLWGAAHDSLRARQKSFGFKRALPRLASTRESKYLLSGFVRCGVCGGSIVQSLIALKSVYRCWYNWSRGSSVCSNTLTVPQDRADLAVLRAIERDVLDPDVVETGLTLALQELTQASRGTAARREELRADLIRIEAELVRYAEAIADAGPLETIVAAIKVREHRRDSIRAELKALAPQKSREFDAGGIRATLREYLTDWTTMARAGVVESRRLLREVLVDRIVFRPVPRPLELPPVKGPGRRARLVYEFTGEASLSKLFADLIYVSPVVAPTGRARFRLSVTLSGIARRRAA